MSGRAHPRLGKVVRDGLFVELQVRAFLAGRVAVFPPVRGLARRQAGGAAACTSPGASAIPLLMTPFHLVARVFGAPTFRCTRGSCSRTSDDVPSRAGAAQPLAVRPGSARRQRRRRRLPRGLPDVRRPRPGAVLESRADHCDRRALGPRAAGRTVALVRRCTPARLVLLCAAAGFSIIIWPTLAVYVLTTVAIALLVARRDGASLRTLASGAAGYAATTFLFAVGNLVRFGSPFNLGYANNLSGSLMNRLLRWGLPFARVPFATAAKEMLAGCSLDPLSRVSTTRPAVRPFAVAARYREYYAPTYDLLTASVLLSAVVIACCESRASLVAARPPPRRRGADRPRRVGSTPVDCAVRLLHTAVGLCHPVRLGLLPRLRSGIPLRRAGGCGGSPEQGSQLTALAQVAIVGLMGLYLASSREGCRTCRADRFERPMSRRSRDSRRPPPSPSPLPITSGATRPATPSPSSRISTAGITTAHSPPGWCSLTGELVRLLRVRARRGRLEDADTRRWRRSGRRPTPTRWPLRPRGGRGLRRVTLCEPHAPAYALDGMRL